MQPNQQHGNTQGGRTVMQTRQKPQCQNQEQVWELTETKIYLELVNMITTIDAKTKTTTNNSNNKHPLGRF